MTKAAPVNSVDNTNQLSQDIATKCPEQNAVAAVILSRIADKYRDYRDAPSQLHLSQPEVDSLKKSAKKIKKATDCEHVQALDAIAKVIGFESWSLLSKKTTENPIFLMVLIEDMASDWESDAMSSADRLILLMCKGRKITFDTQAQSDAYIKGLTLSENWSLYERISNKEYCELTGEPMGAFDSAILVGEEDVQIYNTAKSTDRKVRLFRENCHVNRFSNQGELTSFLQGVKDQIEVEGFICQTHEDIALLKKHVAMLNTVSEVDTDGRTLDMYIKSADGQTGHCVFANDGSSGSAVWSNEPKLQTESVDFYITKDGEIIDSLTIDGDRWRDLDGEGDVSAFARLVLSGMAFEQAMIDVGCGDDEKHNLRPGW